MIKAFLTTDYIKKVEGKNTAVSPHIGLQQRTGKLPNPGGMRQLEKSSKAPCYHGTARTRVVMLMMQMLLSLTHPVFG